jgi:hypothetical protein
MLAPLRLDLFLIRLPRDRHFGVGLRRDWVWYRANYRITTQIRAVRRGPRSGWLARPKQHGTDWLSIVRNQHAGW